MSSNKINNNIKKNNNSIEDNNKTTRRYREVVEPRLDEIKAWARDGVPEEEMAKRLGIEEGTQAPNTIFEICYKDDALGDPLINDHHAVALGAATYEELAEIYDLTARINKVLIEMFSQINIRLVDFKIEFGKTADGKIVLADEISPDTCRLWDADTNEKLDKDRFRRDMGKVIEAYEEINARLNSIK